MHKNVRPPPLSRVQRMFVVGVRDNKLLLGSVIGI